MCKPLCLLPLAIEHIHTIERPPPPQAVFTLWQNRAKLGGGFLKCKIFFSLL
jgi:hypothetical protein